MKKNIWKRLLSLALALVMVSGWLPHMATEAYAAAPIKLEGTIYAYEPGQGFKIWLNCACSKCLENFNSFTNYDTHKYEITSYSYSISGGNYSISVSGNFTGCNGKAAFSQTLSGTFSCTDTLYEESSSVAIYTGSTRVGSISLRISRNTSDHQGDATCVTADNCNLCGTSYTNTSNHEKPDEFTYSVNTSDSTKHDKKYACCGAVSETATHSDFTYSLNGNMFTKTCGICGHAATATLTADDAVYTGTPITAASITYSDGWQGEEKQPAEIADTEYINNTNAGTATVTTTVEGNKLTTTFKITAKELTSDMVTLSPANGSYTGTAVTQPTVTVADGTAMTANDYTISWPDDPDWINAGTITVTVTGQNNYKGTVTKDFVIGKASAPAITFPEVLNAITYGQKLEEAKLSFYENEFGTFNWNAPTSVPNAGTAGYALDFYPNALALQNYDWKAAGEAQWIADRNALCICPNVTVNKAAATITTDPTPNALTYDGTEQTLVAAGSTNDGTMVYSLEKEGTYTETPPEAMAVSTYTVWYKVIGDSNHDNSEPDSVTAEIKQRPVTVTANNASKTYGDTDPELTWKVTSGEALASEPLVINISRAAGENAGDYTITVSQTEGANSNYDITFVNGTFKINKASMTVTANDYEDTYDGAAHGITVNAPNGATVKYGTTEGTYNLTDAPTYTNAGTYTVYYEVTKANYETVTGSKTVTINPIEVTVTVDAIADQPYTGSPITPAVTVTPEEGKMVGEDKLVAGTDYTVFFSDNNTNVGTVTVTISDVAGGNYTVSGSRTFQIVKAENVWTTAPAISGWTYSETANTPGGKAKFGDMTVTYAKKGTETFTSDVPTQAGEYTAKFTVEAAANYNGLTETADFTIAKKALAVTEAIATGREYDGTKTVVITEVKLSGVKEGDAVTVDVTDLTGTLESADKGTYTAVTLPALTLSAGTDNYTLTQPTAPVKTNVEITAKPITVKVADIAEQIIWTGSALTPAEITPEGLVAETDEYCTVTYTDNTNVGIATVKVEAKGNYSFDTIEKTFLIVPDENLLDGLTTANVTSADKTDVDKAVTMMNNADMNDAPEEDKADWEALKNLANTLQDKLEAADAADETQNIQDAENINANNVKLDQKQDLEDALKDLEAAKENYSGNYTQAEKNALEADIKRIEAALAAIERVEDFNTAIDDPLLKEDVKTDMDADTEQAIKDAQAAYNALSDHEKTLVDPADKTKLDTLVATITAYKITKGAGGRYTVGSGKTLSFTANGPVRKFDYVQVNGKTIASSNYTVTEGSTIITLKSSYLDKLGYGKHKIQIFYTDGSTDVADFRIYVNGGNPFTGDNTHMMFFTGIMMTSLLCMVMMVMFVPKKKGKYQR